MDAKIMQEIMKNILSDLFCRTGTPLPKELEGGNGSGEKLVELAVELTTFLEKGKKNAAPENKVDSVFNYLNEPAGKTEKKYWPGGMTIKEETFGYPQAGANGWKKDDYIRLQKEISEEIRTVRSDRQWFDSILDSMEEKLIYVPAGCGNSEISMYEHLKMSMAVGACLDACAKAGKPQQNAEEAKKELLFQLFSMDVSGIQDFIYTISSKGALKSLRARSFYLEIMMEHMVDELLDAAGLCRANLIYSGGGHCYILFPNTPETEEKIHNMMEIMNEWFLEHFQISLYVGYALAPCSPATLKNEPEGSYAELFRTISSTISEKKMHRYDAAQIRWLNHYDQEEGIRECSVCKRTDHLDEENHCEMCGSLLNFSRDILRQEYFSVVCEKKEGALPLPGGKYLISGKAEKNAVHIYRKNAADTGKHQATRLWVGDYTAADTFEEMADGAEGIRRLAVYRADVDNLGTAFVSGFKNRKTGKNESSLARTAALSRNLSLFFKYHINHIIKGKTAAVVYAGGDDLFVVGAWNDVIRFALDLKKELEQFSQSRLTISGGIGLYPDSYPVNIMAEETAELEEDSKSREGKNSITLFSGDYSFGWDEFGTKVMGEKYRCIEEYFTITNDRGKNFLYNLLELIRGYHGPGTKNRNGENQINLVRYVYLLSRMEPEKDDPLQREAYLKFSKEMYRWIKEEEDRKQLMTAIYIYVYKIREGEKQNGSIKE